MSQPVFVFIQMEFPWVLGPADGRYLMRRPADGEPERVIVIGTLQAPRATATGLRHRQGRRGRVVAPEPEPETVSTTRVTCIDPVSLSLDSQARAWLEELDREREVDGAVAAVNRVLHAHRIATADPYVHEVSARQALVVRAGWGEGEQVADGRWAHARALPSNDRGRRSRRRDRSAALRPQERLAAMLGARHPALLCEEVTLRARQDLDQGRLVHAALELERAYELALTELRDEGRQDLALRLAELEQLQPGVRDGARAALRGGLEGDGLEHALGRLEAALRARTAAGL